MSDEQRERVVEAVYHVLTSTNAKTLTDLANDRNWFFHLMSKSDPKSRKLLISSLTQLTGEAGRQWLESLMRAQKTAAMKKKREAEKKKQIAAQKKALAKKKAIMRALSRGNQKPRGLAQTIKYEVEQTEYALGHLLYRVVEAKKRK